MILDLCLETCLRRHDEMGTKSCLTIYLGIVHALTHAISVVAFLVPQSLYVSRTNSAIEERKCADDQAEWW